MFPRTIKIVRFSFHHARHVASALVTPRTKRPPQQQLLPQQPDPILGFLAEERIPFDVQTKLVNFSGTHDATPPVFLQPRNTHEVSSILDYAVRTQRKIRPIGSALSPNGIGLGPSMSLSLRQSNAVLHVDPVALTCRVQAGATVSDVVEHLRPYGMTLQNFGSISLQQIAGFFQVSVHGTGATLPPVDGQVMAMQLATPSRGVLELSATSHPDLFHLARVGMGAMGVVTEVTLQCVPAHWLLEHTTVMPRAAVAHGHAERLRTHRHVRYMWIPYSDDVVVVTTDQVAQSDPRVARFHSHPPDLAHSLAPLRALATELHIPCPATTSFATLRDVLLSHAPTDTAHVARVNRAEAEFWRRRQGVTGAGPSDTILGFDCGGQQWVAEAAFPCGTLAAPTGRDLAYMHDLLALIETKRLPAAAPVEQRWTARTASRMSPAHRDGEDPATLYCWVGFIMYIVPRDDASRRAITAQFTAYRGAVASSLYAKYDAYDHWAKLELPQDPAQLRAMQLRIARRFPVAQFNATRRLLDHAGTCSNTLVDTLFPMQS